MTHTSDNFIITNIISNTAFLSNFIYKYESQVTITMGTS